MKYRFLVSLFLLGLSLVSFAQHPNHHVEDDPQETEPFEKGFPKNYETKKTNPEVTTGIKKYIIEESGPPQKNFGVVPIHDNRIFGFFFIDRIEQRFHKNNDITLWDATGRVGNDDHRIYIETEGEYNSSLGNFKESRNELLYGYVFSSFWDIQAGYRRDFINDKDDRDFGVLSLQGMTPFQFEVDAASYISSEGDLSALLELEYSFLLTQRTQLIPRIEVEASLQEVEDYDIGRGLNGFEMGLRLSHQIWREFAPYIGVSWEKQVFNTKDLLEEAGEDTSEAVFLIGARIII